MLPKAGEYAWRRGYNPRKVCSLDGVISSRSLLQCMELAPAGSGPQPVAETGAAEGDGRRWPELLVVGGGTPLCGPAASQP
jgi:hypothetical protein